MDSKPNAPKVLVVDDEIGPRESLKMILKKNYKVFTAESGSAAMMMFQTVKPDVITLDLKMPGASGMEILNEIRKIDQDVKVILVTGWVALLDMMDALCHGVFGCITKPFNIPEVIRMIEESLNKKKSASAVDNLFDQVS